MDKTNMAIDTYNHIINEYIKYLKEINEEGGVPFQREIDFLFLYYQTNPKY